MATVLVVDDELLCASSLARHLVAWGYGVAMAGTVRTATLELSRVPDVVISDMCLPDGSGLDVFSVARQGPRPPVMIGISGAATRQEVFALAGLGVHGYFEKPLDLVGLKAALTGEGVRERLQQAASESVGRVALRDVDAIVRTTLFSRALSMSEGNLSRAARLLGVSRQAVQKAVASGIVDNDKSA